MQSTPAAQAPEWLQRYLQGKVSPGNRHTHRNHKRRVKIRDKEINALLIWSYRNVLSGIGETMGA